MENDRKIRGPVSWLLGRQLLNSAKGILLYIAFGRKLDPRDWMRAAVYPSSDQAKALYVWRMMNEGEAEKADEVAAANPIHLREEKDFWKNKGEFWFDYISDTGDGTKATYTIAYLCLSDLYVTSLVPGELKADDQVRTRLPKDDATTKCLPRGEFLFVGGDTAYHVSDYMTLATRFQNPFKWAYEDLANDLREFNLKKRVNRPIFGIPGNHDYYDQLDGFRRQFSRSVRTQEKLRGPIPDPPPDENDEQKKNRLSDEPQLFLPGFIRKQQASYIALHLPFDWWMWGLDTEVGRIDERQKKFFRDLCKKDPAGNDLVAPKKLIVATCAPTTVFGKVAAPNDGRATDAFLQLGIKRPFLPEKRKDGIIETISTIGDEKLDAGDCRLDISGNVHHYARYWGPKPMTSPGEPVRKQSTAPAPSATSYASVVSGIGGAFHHPSKTYMDEVQEQALYPSETKSTEEVARRIFNPWKIFLGGNVGLAGFVIAFSIYFAATVPQSSKYFINHLFSRTMQYGSSLYSLIIGQRALEHMPSWDSWTAILPSLLSPLKSGTLLLLISLSLLIYAVFRRKFFDEVPPGSPNANLKTQDWSTVMLGGIAVASGATLFLGYYQIYRQHNDISPFVRSAVILLSIIWAGLAGALSIRYSELLFNKAHHMNIHWYWWIPNWSLTIASIVAVAIGLWLFGGNIHPAHLASDLVFIAVSAVSTLGLIIFSVVASGDLLRPKRKAFNKEISGLRKLRMIVRRSLIGLWHSILQIGVPIALVWKGTIPVWTVAILLMAGMGALGSALLKRNYRMLLLFVWLGYGALMLVLPDLFARLLPGLKEPFFAGGLTGWWGCVPKALIPPVVAGVFGLVMACVWFGWYLAVCFAFNGHNNEVGGASQIEQFKQFIRFRLTEDGLTGYVIGVTQPMGFNDREKIDPRIVDVFHLQVKEPSRYK